MENNESNIDFNTREDKEVFYKILTRTIFPIDREVKGIHKVDTEKQCDVCIDKHADFKVGKQPEDSFQIYICYQCLEEEVNKWVEEQLGTLKQELKRYKVADEL